MESVVYVSEGATESQALGDEAHGASMELFLHHVGRAGAEADFPKSVFGDVALDRIASSIPLDDPFGGSMLEDLLARFPGGSCNVWGVPVGARTAMSHLTEAGRCGLPSGDRFWHRVGARHLPRHPLLEPRLPCSVRSSLGQSPLPLRVLFRDRAVNVDLARDAVGSRLSRELAAAQLLPDQAGPSRGLRRSVRLARPHPSRARLDERGVFRPGSERARSHGPNGESEVEVAHIYPKHLDGSDDPRNGVCLCRPHQWALDVGWIGIADDRTVLVRGDLPQGADYDFLRRWAGERLRLPDDDTLWPHPLFLRAHRRTVGLPD